jgi:hypothetical protein
MEGAPCHRAPDLFFSDNPTELDEAKDICASECPFATHTACKRYADDNNIEFGVWGGISRDERVERQCVACEETKLLGEFGAHVGYVDGLNVRCQECVREAGERFAKNLPDREASVALLRAAAERRRTERKSRIQEYGRLRDECGMGRTQAAEVLRITERTAQRYERALKQQVEVAA